MHIQANICNTLFKLDRKDILSTMLQGVECLLLQTDPLCPWMGPNMMCQMHVMFKCTLQSWTWMIIVKLHF